MSGHFWVDSDGLADGGYGYEDLANGVSRVNLTLNDIAPYEGSWGGDDAGQKFEPVYLESKQAFSDGVVAMAETLGMTSEGLLQLAYLAGGTEKRNGDLAYQLLEPPAENKGGGGDKPAGDQQPLQQAQLFKRSVVGRKFQRMLTMEEMRALGMNVTGPFKPVLTTLTEEEVAKRRAPLLPARVTVVNPDPDGDGPLEPTRFTKAVGVPSESIPAEEPYRGEPPLARGFVIRNDMPLSEVLPGEVTEPVPSEWLPAELGEQPTNGWTAVQRDGQSFVEFGWAPTEHDLEGVDVPGFAHLEPTESPKVWRLRPPV